MLYYYEIFLLSKGKKAEKTVYIMVENCTSYSSDSGLAQRICEWLQKLSHQITKTANQQIEK